MVRDKTGNMRDVGAFQSGDDIRLVRVHDTRFHDFCDPPKEHLGEKIKLFMLPDEIGRLGLAYLTGLVSEAEEWVTDSKAIAK
jgi:hypothetical protein